MQNKANKKLYAFIAIVLAISLLALYGLKQEISVSALKSHTQSFGYLAPAVYILIFTLIPLTLIPNSLVAISGGALFGVYCGTFYTVIGAVFGATLSFVLSRYFGKNIAEKHFKNKAQWINEHAEKSGFMIVFLLRLIPVVPFDAISYGAGLSRIRYFDFAGATSLGILPGVLVYSNIGDKSVDIHSADFLLSVAILLALVALSHALKKHYALKDIQKISTTT